MPFVKVIFPSNSNSSIKILILKAIFVYLSTINKYKPLKTINMKKSLLFVSALILGSLSASAQITITTADIASPVKIIYQANDTLLTSPTIIGSFGISQTWNMSALNAHTIDTMTFMSYAWVPSTDFPTSNLVVKQGSQYAFSYLTNSASGLSAEGYRALVNIGTWSDTVSQISTPSEKIINFPSTYLSSFTNNYTTRAYFGVGVDPGFGVVIDSIRQKSVAKKTLLVDAWGSLTTPLGTFNVLRVEETIVKHDTTDIMAFATWNPFPGTPQITADSTTSYSWWANGVGFPLVSIALDSLSNIKQAQWLQVLPAVGINEYTAPTQVNVYPNPAQNEITFAVEASKIGSIQVFDVAGRIIDSYPVLGALASINTSNFANGIYTYALISKDNVVLNRGKFTVAK